MKILHAIDDANIVPVFFEKTGAKPNIMISYHYLEGNASKLMLTYRDMIGSLYIDSGAFSAHTKKALVSIHEYRRYMKRYGHFIDVYFNLDDRFDDPDHNLLNQLFLEEGLGDAKKPIPVIHDPEDPFRELQMYAEMGHDYIALGSMGSHKRIDPVIMTKVNEMYPELKIHLFGNLNRKILEKYKPYSADSSTWAQQGGKAGSVYYWRPSENKGYTYYVGARESSKVEAVHIKKSPFWREIEAFLHDTLGYTYGDLLTSAEAKQVVNLYFFKQYEDYLNSRDSAGSADSLKSVKKTK